MGARPRVETGAERRLLEVVLEQLPVGVVVAEAPSGRILTASRYARELVGGDLDARGVADYGQFDMRRADGRVPANDELPMARALRGEAVRAELYELLDAGGGHRLVSVSATPVADDAGAPVAAVTVFEDVTDRLRALRADREFVANAAHELRTPLAAIASAIEVLQAGAKELPHERDVFLDHVERETKRLARLGRALLLIARSQTRAEQPRVEIVALRPLLDDVAAATRPADAVRLSVRCPKRLAALANRDLLEQALLNLAQNATRYTARGSIVLRGRADGDRAVLEVADTGPGFDAGDRDSAFRRFIRPAGDDGEGYGLGLSIARQAVEAAGCALELDTAPGRGTTARVLAPLARLV